MTWFDVRSIFFFFQAEDGIRAGHVTGVQTCALPISGENRARRHASGGELSARLEGEDRTDVERTRVRFTSDRKSTRLNSSHVAISYAVFCLKKKTKHRDITMSDLIGMN